MIDAHCHLEYMPLTVVDEAREKMNALISSVANPKDVEKILSVQEKNRDFVFVALGLHPEEAEKQKDEDIEKYIELIRKNRDRIVSVGEVGLDYHWIKTLEDQQRSKEVFLKFIQLTKELNLPMTIHSRNSVEKNDQGKEDAISEVIEMLTAEKIKDVMLHCFSGSEDNLKDALNQGWLISFSTLVVKSKRYQRLAASTPLEQMLLETDAPWLDPESKELVNRPWKIEQSAEIIAKIKEKTKEEILKKTEDNAINFFRLQDKAIVEERK